VKAWRRILPIDWPNNPSRHARESDFGLHIPSILQEDEMTFMLGPESHRSHGPRSSQGEVPDQHSDIEDIGSTESPTFGARNTLAEKVDWKSPDTTTFPSTTNDHHESQNVAFWHHSPHELEDRDSLGYDTSPLSTTSSGKLSSRIDRAEMSMVWAQRRKPTFSPRTSLRGMRYTLVPAAFIKKMAHSVMRTQGIAAKIDIDVITHLADISDWFLQQISADLDAYASHAGRSIINESDVNLLMAR
jgi:histone H3/H4